jgi:signal transduction histidine kinase
MGSISSPDTTERLLFLYLAEFVLGFLLFLIFRHFGNLYRRRFLYTWSLSWLAFAVYVLSTGILQALILKSDSFFWTAVNVTTQLACFLQVILILRGTYELLFERAFSKKKFRIILITAFAIALLTVLAFSQHAHDPQHASLRHMLPVGSRTLFTGVGFLITGMVVWRNKKFSKGFGQRLLAASFIIYSLYQLYYCSVVVLNLLGQNVSIPDFYGIIDLLLIAVMGMSMVMWLLEDEREKLEKANKELDQFLYSTSHDLRAPIASILGLTYLGKLEFEEEKARTFMDMIEARIKKLDLVIGDILSLSRSKKIAVKIEPLNLQELLDNTITDIKFNKGASAISLDYTPDPSHVFRSDVNQMKIILSNLLGNAVKYHNLDQPNPIIRVTFTRQKDYVEIAVEDNGQGIPPESVPKIFDMFYRASLSTEGTGLGLYIVREALNKIKGTIAVRSEVGKGSTFTIILDNA